MQEKVIIPFDFVSSNTFTVTNLANLFDHCFNLKVILKKMKETRI
jgi:hypothetical protein